MTTIETNYDIIEVAASTPYGSIRDYGSHPVPLTWTEDFELPELISQPFPEDIPAPDEWLKWGRWRKEKQARAWHHYAADTKLQTLLRNPSSLTDTGAKFSTELNCSSFVDDPMPVALANLWRKRCISRFWQDQGIQVAVDLNVNGWTRELVLDGVPKTHALWSTRYMRTDLSGEPAGVDLLIDDFGLVADHVDEDVDVLFVVYGGGKQVAAMCDEFAWLHLPSSSHQKTAEVEEG